MASSSGNSGASANASTAKDKKNAQEAANQFNAMREEQRQIGMRISQLEMEAREHALVIDVLQKVPTDRKCFRMVGGVLVERTAGEVLPTLTSNREQMLTVVEQMKTRLTDKGRELNEFKARHGIRVAGEGEGQRGGEDGSSGSGDKAGGGGVLVA